MPYTPPAQLSPAASKQPSPTPSRSHSYIKGQFLSPELPASSGRPNLPRSSASSSYLTKHRRSPSLNDVKSDVVYNGEAFQENGSFDPHGSLRKSPPPVSNALIPAGMTISPPESSQNSSDEEEPHRGRTRDLELENLEALQKAIRLIEQRKAGSPDRNIRDNPTINKTAPAASQVEPKSQPQGSGTQRPPLSQEARKISHSRSSTDSSIVFEPPAIQTSLLQTPEEPDDSDSDGPLTNRPPMVRKKSGELVRPALRPSSRRRPSSMPGTPTYSKAVHFDSHLEHVRHFLQVDRPLAVSAGSSPVETYESENEFPFGSDESAVRPRGSQYEWELRLANFPPPSEARKSQPVFVEKVSLSSDQKNLVGTVAVQNLAFHKLVIARFTFDYWKTTSEIVADYNNDVRRKHNHDGLDRFSFTIRLADQTKLENKTLFFCVRYTVNGQDYWDNNSSFNYQVDFVKKPKVQPGTSESTALAAQPANALPRSRPSPPTSSGRPKSLPTSFDDFSTGFDSFSSFGQSAGSLIGEPKLKLRSPRSKAELLPDSHSRRRQGGGNAFGSRYDFNSSLTAAKNNAYAVLGDHAGFSSRADTKQSSHEVPAATAAKSLAIAPPKDDVGVIESPAGASPTPAAALMTSKPAALVSEKPPLTSQSYQELVDKYCFVGARGNSEEVRTHGSANSLAVWDSEVA
ncbi:hypothetical protein A1O3_06535 [Capronia epimyces CBS 606.96]|uniref:CBM21 domain-containing protein n=1 Tax=Capronia epimyces CBS 606.96 TaxID=1182542 RepID=W9Y0F5_9EURO|nr:uncharacterized protein A1O3_06535 [Capronia epimyces CBS 606.96]EXJ82721.1 hypothetical protein A1O3_06535 [Capronia epimyces CBS 606.96]